MRKTGFLGVLGALACLTAAMPASAGVDACNNIRFEGLSNCEVLLTAECTASCDVGIYKTACATKLVPVCKEECTLSADATCTDECTVQCKTDCDNGVNVICAHNCFDECTVDRDAGCSDAADPAQCKATWDANCDNECDLQCVTVDGGCYTHCIECCGGSCTADANMDCQTTCQDKVFEECEQELRATCEGSCSGDGALFCDGKYIVSGSQLEGCVKALAAEGITVKAEGTVTIGPDGVDGNLTGGLCSFRPAAPETDGSLGAPLVALAAAAGWLSRRRKKDSKKS
ncbi:MAG: hypothetical protein R3B70_20855 [Polyangiaceae bacterium]